MAALFNAHRKGVRIRMLVDGFNGVRHLSACRSFWYLASLPDIEIRFYNPIKKFPLYKINYRLHDKYLIADDKVYLLGGRNLCDVSLGQYKNKTNIDRDVMVQAEKPGMSPSLQELRQYFEEIWNLPCCGLIQSPPDREYSGEKEKLLRRYAALQKKNPVQKTEDIYSKMLPVSEIRLLRNPVSAEKKTPELWKNLYDVMIRGEEIYIQTPYMICDKMMYQDLQELCDTAKKVRIITNSPETGANPWGCSDYMNQRNNILKTGTEIYEYSGIQSLHTKSVICDRDISIIGSFNMDMRSTYLDTELMLLIRSPELNSQLRDSIYKLKSCSRHLYPDGSEKIGSSYEYMPMDHVKKSVYSCLRLLCVVASPGRKYL